MKVSVIITTYQRSTLLSEAIESVLAQTFRDFELIIVNDDPLGYSSEKTVSLYKDPRIVYIKNEKNLGGAKSLNVGLRAAKGECIAILDDDDSWISKDKLEKQVDFLEKNKDYVIVGTGLIVVDGQGKEITRSTGSRTKIDDIRKILLLENLLAHSSVLYRKDIALSVGGYSEELPRGKDMDLYLKIAKFGKFGFLPDCLIKYRDISSKERNIIETRYKDLSFQRKIINRYKNSYPYFWRAYFLINLKYIIFFVLRIFPSPYNIYRKFRKYIINKNN